MRKGLRAPRTSEPSVKYGRSRNRLPTTLPDDRVKPPYTFELPHFAWHGPHPPSEGLQSEGMLVHELPGVAGHGAGGLGTCSQEANFLRVSVSVLVLKLVRLQFESS